MSGSEDMLRRADVPQPETVAVSLYRVARVCIALALAARGESVDDGTVSRQPGVVSRTPRRVRSGMVRAVSHNPGLPVENDRHRRGSVRAEGARRQLPRYAA